MTLEELKYNNKLSGQEKLTKDEIDLILELEEEHARRGNFLRVYPLPDNVQHYEPFFEVKRYQNYLLSTYLTAPETVKSELTREYKRISFSEV